MLADRGNHVFGIDLHHGPGEVGWEHEMGMTEANYARCDVADFRQLDRVFLAYGPFDFVFHTAGEFGRWNGEDYYEQLWRTNAIGTKNVIRLQEKLRFKLIHFSSSEVYGDYEGLMKEEVMDHVEIKQLNDYAMSKWVNENQIRNSRIMHDTQTVIVRLFNTYGPGEWFHPYRSVNAKFCYSALFNLPITVYRGHTRCSTYLEDTCCALANIADNFVSGEVYNIGGLEQHSIEELAEIVWRQTGADPQLIAYRSTEVLTTKDKKVDSSKAMKDLGFRTTVSLEEGLCRTIEWMGNYYFKGQRSSIGDMGPIGKQSPSDSAAQSVLGYGSGLAAHDPAQMAKATSAT
jgi:dTDP-glucose 4,6-dehydratase